jgi:hypothetical protein
MSVWGIQSQQGDEPAAPICCDSSICNPALSSPTEAHPSFLEVARRLTLRPLLLSSSPEYVDDNAMVPKNASVIVKRIPAKGKHGLLSRIKSLTPAVAMYDHFIAILMGMTKEERGGRGAACLRACNSNRVIQVHGSHRIRSLLPGIKLDFIPNEQRLTRTRPIARLDAVQPRP